MRKQRIRVGLRYLEKQEISLIVLYASAFPRAKLMFHLATPMNNQCLENRCFCSFWPMLFLFLRLLVPVIIDYFSKISIVELFCFFNAPYQQGHVAVFLWTLKRPLVVHAAIVKVTSLRLSHETNYEKIDLK